MGIGAISNAVLKSLDGHKNLGIHTEMFSDGIIDLVERGIINNKLKKRGGVFAEKPSPSGYSLFISSSDQVRIFSNTPPTNVGEDTENIGTW